MQLTLSFYECEHDGDLGYYIDDLASSGAKVIDSNVDYDGEVGTVVIEVADKAKFDAAFKKTSAYGFLNGRYT